MQFHICVNPFAFFGNSGRLCSRGLKASLPDVWIVLQPPLKPGLPHLKGLSTGDYAETLQALRGVDPKGFSPSVIVRLEEKWGQEHEEWSRLELSVRCSSVRPLTKTTPRGDTEMPVGATTCSAVANRPCVRPGSPPSAGLRPSSADDDKTNSRKRSNDGRTGTAARRFMGRRCAVTGGQAVRRRRMYASTAVPMPMPARAIVVGSGTSTRSRPVPPAETLT
jgi:hypothetical protein